MTRQGFCREMALQRREAENPTLVVPQDKAHQAVTEAADSVVEDDRIFHSIPRKKSLTPETLPYNEISLSRRCGPPRPKKKIGSVAKCNLRLGRTSNRVA